VTQNNEFDPQQQQLGLATNSDETIDLLPAENVAFSYNHIQAHPLGMKAVVVTDGYTLLNFISRATFTVDGICVSSDSAASASAKFDIRAEALRPAIGQESDYERPVFAIDGAHSALVPNLALKVCRQALSAT
jgi:hypothetical protein